MKRPFERYSIIFWGRRLLYGWLLIQMLILLPQAATYWSADAIIPTFGWAAWDSSVFLNLFEHPLVQKYYWIFIAVHIAALLIGLWGKFPRSTAFIIFLTTTNLINGMAFAITGGEVLIKLLLFYLIFADERPGRSAAMHRDVRNRTALLAIQINIVLVYLWSGWYKLQDPLWLNGEAMHWISRVDAFSNSGLEALMQYPVIYISATYCALAYQLLFPIAVCWRPIKRPFLIVGICFHLFIAFGMGLFSFGMIMIIAYSFFLRKMNLKKLHLD